MVDIRLVAKGNRYFRLRPPGVSLSEPYISQHLSLANAYEAAVVHAAEHGIDGVYTVQPPDGWEITTMGFGVVSVPPPTSPGMVWLESTALVTNEGMSLQFFVRRGSGKSGAVAVDWSIVGLPDGVATPAAGTVSWADGETGPKQVSVQIGDVQADEAGVISLLNPRSLSGGAAPTLGTSSASLSVLMQVGGEDPNESKLIDYLSVANQSIVEGDFGTTNMVFVVQILHALTKDVEFSYHTVDGSAVAWADYVPKSGFAVIPAGSTSVSIPVPIIGDTAVENNETFTLTIADPRYR